MKTSKIVLFLLVTLCFSSCSIFKSGTRDTRTLQQKIESKHFTIGITRCRPTDLAFSTYGTEITLELKNDTAIADLPFHGLLDVNPNNMTQGNVKFNNKVQDFSMKSDDKGGWNFFFRVPSDPYLYQVEMSIDQKGYAVIIINSVKRSTMTYWGEVY